MDGDGGVEVMRINLYTDAPKHNLALMKISTWHKKRGDEVCLNMPIMPCDKSYASILFEKNRDLFHADHYGGPAFPEICLPEEIEKIKPDYNGLGYSLGYTFRPCYRGCEFCKVKEMNHPDNDHHSIWDFHDAKYSKIELLNNNTFMDRQWKETFEEIWDAELEVKEHGFDIRLMDEEKADYLRRTKFNGNIHYAWDRMQDERVILDGLRIAPRGTVYVLIGFDTTEEEDIYRCQMINDYGHDPYIMPYHQSKEEKRFKRFIDSFMWRKYKTLQAAWGDYKR
jgi:hypothetical protein